MSSESGTIAVHDSFVDVLRSDIVAGTEKLSAWIGQIESAGGIETLFELETWLRGLRAFFNVRHLPLSDSERAGLVARSFAPEIRIAKTVLQLSESLSIEVSRLGQAAKVEFEAFLEAQMRKGSGLDYHVSKILEQPTPADSLHRLLESLSDLRVTIDSLGEPGDQDLRLFLALGRSYERALRDCRYVDMLLAQRFQLHYDRVDSAALTGLLRSVPDPGTRRNLALALLHLHRFLRYLRIVARDLAKDAPLRHDLVVFAGLHREIGHFCDYVKARLVKGKRSGQDVRNAGELILHSLRMDGQRLLERELVFAAADVDATTVYTKIENSYGILTNCLQSCVVTIAQAIDPEIDGKVIFPSMEEELQKTQRLRRDLWALRQIFREILERNIAFDLSGVMERLAEFRELSLRYLMYRDWGEFERLSDALITSGNPSEARAHLRNFVNYLDLLVVEVSKRNILKGAQPRERLSD